MENDAQDILNFIKKEFDNKISISLRREAKDISIDIGPKVPSNGPFAKVRVGLHEGYDLTVDIGKGNHFDMQEWQSNTGKQYLLGLIKACTLGDVSEIVTFRGNEVVRSKLIVKLANRAQSLYYRKGIFAFGNRKELIKYKPYE